MSPADIVRNKQAPERDYGLMKALNMNLEDYEDLVKELSSKQIRFLNRNSNQNHQGLANDSATWESPMRGSALRNGEKGVDRVTTLFSTEQMPFSLRQPPSRHVPR